MFYLECSNCWYEYALTIYKDILLNLLLQAVQKVIFKSYFKHVFASSDLSLICIIWSVKYSVCYWCNIDLVLCMFNHDSIVHNYAIEFTKNIEYRHYRKHALTLNRTRLQSEVDLLFPLLGTGFHCLRLVSVAWDWFPLLGIPLEDAGVKRPMCVMKCVITSRAELCHSSALKHSTCRDLCLI